MKIVHATFSKAVTVPCGVVKKTRVFTALEEFKHLRVKKNWNQNQEDYLS